MKFKIWLENFDGESSFQMNLKTAEGNFIQSIQSAIQSMGEYLPNQAKSSFDSFTKGSENPNPFGSTVATLDPRRDNIVSKTFSALEEVEAKALSPLQQQGLVNTTFALSSLQNVVDELYKQIDDYYEYHDEYKAGQINALLSGRSPITSGLSYTKQLVDNVISSLSQGDEQAKMIAYWYKTAGPKMIKATYDFVETVITNMMNFAYDS